MTLAMLLVPSVASDAHSQSARLELRLVAQSGIPGLGGGVPQGCVFDDAQTTVVMVTPAIAKRFEVQGRVMDLDAGDGIDTLGLAGVRLTVRADRDGLWGRARLSQLEAQVEPGAPVTGADCSGAPISAPMVSAPRGLHGAFRAWESSLAVGNDDARNGTFGPRHIRMIDAESRSAGLDAERAAWVGLYSFEYTIAQGGSGLITLRADVEPIAGVAFEWWGRGVGTQRWPGTDVRGASLTLQAPAGPAACCTADHCFIALSPTACFGNGGRLAINPTSGCGAASCCAADYNGDGVRGFQDVLDYLDAYLGGDPRADQDGSGRLTVQDLFEFIADYFTPCP